MTLTDCDRVLTYCSPVNTVLSASSADKTPAFNVYRRMNGAAAADGVLSIAACS